MARVDDVLGKILGGNVPSVASSQVAEKKDWISIFKEAVKAGEKALAEKIPVPMVVAQHTNQLDDSSPIEKSWFVPSGVCGFAWVSVRVRRGDSLASTTLKFINALKKAGFASGANDPNGRKAFSYNDYEKAYNYWVFDGGQSMEKKEAFASAMARVLRDNGINASMRSRID